MKPRIPLTDPAFKYVPAAETSVRLTFMRERRRLKAQQEIEREQEQKVITMRKVVP